MNEPKNRTPINLKNGVKTTREKEATIFLGGTWEKLNAHRRDFIKDMGEKQGRAHFQTNCGDLHGFIEERIKEGLKRITLLQSIRPACRIPRNFILHGFFTSQLLRNRLRRNHFIPPART